MDDLRKRFFAWVNDQGCDTDGAWSAWQAAWDESRKVALEDAAKVVPTNWCDELLTGKGGLGKPPWGCPDIERLLNGITAAIRGAGTRTASDE